MKVVVVGGGVAGLGIGWRLAQQGASVTVLERAQPGHGATWAAAGMISPTPERGFATSPEAVFARQSADLWPQFARELEERTGVAVGYRADGKLAVALTQQEATAHAQQASLLSGLGEWIAPERACAMEPLLRSDIAGALWDPQEAQVDNRVLGLALARAFVAAGGNLEANEAAIRFEREGGRVVGVRTPFRLHQGDAFVMAAGAWSGQIEGLPAEAVPPVVPVKGEMIALDPVAPHALPVRSVWGNEVYLVARAGRLVVGATATREGFDTGLTREARDRLRGGAIALMPALADWPVAEHWAGLRPGSSDDLPILGRSGLENLFVASGQFRNGILFAPAIAQSLSTLILGREPDIDIGAFDPARFARLAKD